MLSKKARSNGPSGPPGSRAYAIGDIHGCFDLMIDLLSRIEADNRALPPAKVYLIFLGDLVDRGPNSKDVIDYLVHRRITFARPIFLKGNHEEYFLAALSGEVGMITQWLAYGGYECADSYGITKGWTLNASPAAVAERLSRHVPQSHKDFLEEMADSFRFGDYLFVHAGIRPGVDLDEQSGKDLRWIREGFLEDRRDHGVMVVHGHTIVDQPQQHPNRIALDTGAYKTGVLTALCLEGSHRRFLEARTQASIAA